jgi:hypothetical protein
MTEAVCHASFKRPLYSFMGDWVMYRDMWRGRVSF